MVIPIKSRACKASDLLGQVASMPQRDLLPPWRRLGVAIVTEMPGAHGGLSWIIHQAVVQIDLVQVRSALFVASALALRIFGLIGAAERRIVFWTRASCAAAGGRLGHNPGISRCTRTTTPVCMS